MTLQQNKSKAQVVEMFSLAIADGFVSPEELTLIYARGAELGLGSQEVDEVILNPESVTFEPPESLVEAILRLYDLGKVVLSDNQIDPREVELLKTFAGRFGIRDDLLDSVVTAVIDEVKAGTSHGDLVALLAKEIAQ